MIPHGAPALSPAPDASNRRARLRHAARERRRAAARLTLALDAGAFAVTSAPRRRLADFTLTAQELAVQAPRPCQAALAMLSDQPDDPVQARLGLFMLEQACAAAQLGGRVSVALPAPRLTRGFNETIAACLAQHGVPPERLEVRLAEAALHDPSGETILALTMLRDQGIGLAIDDFGRRHGSTFLLRRLPLTALHLDPSLTHDVAQDGSDLAIAAAVTEMAHVLGLRVIARAIDTPTRLALLRRIGVDEGLGAACRDTAIAA